MPFEEGMKVGQPCVAADDWLANALYLAEKADVLRPQGLAGWWGPFLRAKAEPRLGHAQDRVEEVDEQLNVKDVRNVLGPIQLVNRVLHPFWLGHVDDRVQGQWVVEGL